MSKGQFKKGNTAAAKKTKKTKSSYQFSADAHTKSLPVEKKPTEVNNKDYEPFGSDNLFPQRVSLLNRKSAVSRSVVTSKRNYVVGQGFETESEDFLKWTPNPNENLRDLTNKAASDKLIGGNAYFEIIKVGDTVINMFHKDHTTARIHKDGEHIIIHPDWGRFESNRKLAKIYPIYPEFEMIDGQQRSMLHIKDYESEFNHYGIPSNIGGIDSANINYKTNKWNLSRLENNFNVSGILNIVANFSEEDAKTFQEKIDTKFIGEGNQGKLLTIVQELGGESNPSTFVPLVSNEDGNWTQLHEQATNEIVIANQWFSSLAGLNVSSGFDTNRIRNDYQIAMSTIIPYEQQFFIEAYQRVLGDNLGMKLDDLSMINTSPISLIDLDNVHQAIIDINTEVVEGRMTKEMAKMTLKVSFQMTQEEVDNLFI